MFLVPWICGCKEYHWYVTRDARDAGDVRDARIQRMLWDALGCSRMLRDTFPVILGTLGYLNIQKSIFKGETDKSVFKCLNAFFPNKYENLKNYKTYNGRTLIRSP